MPFELTMSNREYHQPHTVSGSTVLTKDHLIIQDAIVCALRELFQSQQQLHPNSMAAAAVRARTWSCWAGVSTLLLRNHQHNDVNVNVNVETAPCPVVVLSIQNAEDVAQDFQHEGALGHL